MALLEVLKYPNPILLQKAQPVEKFDDALRKLVADMFETMYADDGVGLAAPQIGQSIRLFVIDCAPRDSFERQPIVLVNPVIVKKDDPVMWNEGCLSLPGIFEDVPSFAHCIVDYFDEYGNPHQLEANELLSVAILHEYEHLEGHVFIERLSPIKRKLTQKYWKNHKQELISESNEKRELRIR